MFSFMGIHLPSSEERTRAAARREEILAGAVPWDPGMAVREGEKVTKAEKLGPTATDDNARRVFVLWVAVVMAVLVALIVGLTAFAVHLEGKP